MNRSVPAIRTRVNAATISSEPSSPYVVQCRVRGVCICVCVIQWQAFPSGEIDEVQWPGGQGRSSPLLGLLSGPLSTPQPHRIHHSICCWHTHTYTHTLMYTHMYTHTISLTQREEAKAEKPKYTESEEYVGVHRKCSETLGRILFSCFLMIFHA